MKKNLKLSIITLVFIVGLFVGGFTSITTQAKQSNPLQIWFQNENGTMSTYNVVDEATGVNYVVVSQDLCSQPAISMCPRYNADGTLYVTE